MRLHRTDDQNARIYYAVTSPSLQRDRLLCFQMVGRYQFELVACTREGEPGYTIPHAGLRLNRLPDEDCATAHAFRVWAFSQPLEVRHNAG